MASQVVYDDDGYEETIGEDDMMMDLIKEISQYERC